MTTATTSWTTSADIPLNAWTPLVADMRALLDVAAAGGATVTNPTGAGAATLTDNTIAFTVQAAAPAPPMTVQFTRAAGEGSVETGAPTTGGLVAAALTRAARYWGPLLSWSTDVDTKARAVARELIEGLFGDGDRAVAGLSVVTSQQGAVSEVASLALSRVLTADTGNASRVQLLTTLIAELTAERDGTATAGAMLTPKAAPAKLVAEVHAELGEPAEEESAEKPAPRRRAARKPATSKAKTS